MPDCFSEDEQEKEEEGAQPLKSRLSLELARLGEEQEWIARRQERLSHRLENL
jgi:hypothetical protein